MTDKFNNEMKITKNFQEKPAGNFTLKAVKEFEENLIRKGNFLEENRSNYLK